MATAPVVPDPLKGSRTVSPTRLPANMHGSINSGGNVAQCASLYGLVVTVHTVLLFAVIACSIFFPWCCGLASLCSLEEKPRATAFILPLVLPGTRPEPS